MITFDWRIMLEYFIHFVEVFLTAFSYWSSAEFDWVLFFMFAVAADMNARDAAEH